MFEIKAKEKMVERALIVGAYIDPAKKADNLAGLEFLIAVDPAAAIRQVGNLHVGIAGVDGERCNVLMQ